MPAPTTTTGAIMSSPSTVDTGSIAPLIVTSSEALAISGAANILLANTIYLYAFELFAPTTFSGAKWRTGSTAAGTVDAGIYSFSGTLLANIGGTSLSASSNMSVNFSGGNVTLGPGQYFAAFTPSTSTDTFQRAAIGNPAFATRCRQATNASSGTPVVLNAATGGYSDAPANFPSFSLTVVNGLT